MTPELAALIEWADRHWVALLGLAVLFGLVTVYADRHPETADRWAARLYPEWRR